MAEILAVSVVDVITIRVVSLISQEIGLAPGVRRELENLQSTVSDIGALLHEADRRQILSQDVKDWIGKLRDVVYDVDDLLDDFSSEALFRQRVMGRWERVLNEVRTFFSSSNQILYAFKMAHRAKDIRKRFDAISDDKFLFQLEGNTRAALGSLVENRVRPETYPFESKPYVIGRDEDKEKVIEFLLNPHFEGNVSILPIVGMGGMGKTTFARLVFNDESVKEYFTLRRWVCVSTNFNVTDILTKIVQERTQNKLLAQQDMNGLQRKLGEEVHGERFLLVLDGVWNEDQDKWLELLQFLRKGAKGSKILVTTRTPRVATTMAATYHPLSGLPEYESLTLLMRMARKQEHEWRGTALEVIAKEIVRKCVGVPLAITTIGRLLLFTRNREEEWLRVKNIDLSRSDQDETDIMPTLKLSYDLLPPHLRQCFAYCSLFPKDSVLEPSELIRLWMAQGFIKSTWDERRLEEIGHDYFMELTSRSFFQELEEDTVGHVSGCKMHDLMHDLARSVAGEECATVSYQRVRQIPEGARHVSVVHIEDNAVLKGFETNRKIRSLLFTLEYTRTIETFHLDVSCFRNLRALRLQGIGIGVLPSTIGKLKRLRSLDLSWNRELRSLPNSISRLCNLKILNLRGCSNLEKLPRGITKLERLRLLDVRGCDKLRFMPRGIGKLTDLQMLSEPVVKEKRNSRAARLTGFGRLTGLKKELIDEHLEMPGSILSEVDASFSMKKHALQSPELRWESVDQEKYGANNEEVLERLQPHSDLKELVIEGYGGIKLSSWVSQLHQLVKIEISYCNECIHVPPLDRLSSLRVISLKKLRELEWIELSESWKLEQPLFRSLEVLELKHLPNFRGWERRRSCGNIDNIEERETQEEENVQGEKVEEGSPSCALSTYSPPKVAATIENCPRFSYIQGQQLHLGRTMNEILWQLLRNTTQAVLDPSMMVLDSSMMKFINVSSISLSKLTSLSLCGMKDTKHLPMELFQSLPSLQSLVISCCPRLKSLCIREILQHLTELERLEIRDLASLDLSNDDNDGDDGGEGMHNLQQHGHSKLRHLMIKGIFKMESLPGWILYLPNLEILEISSCFSLKSLSGRLIHCLLTTLKSLVIKCSPELDLTWETEDREDILNFLWNRSTKFRELEFQGIMKMHSLPWWIRGLSNLESLKLVGCPNLGALPWWFPRSSPLRRLTIDDCKELSRRCKRDTGEDWPKISRIQNVHLSDDND